MSETRSTTETARRWWRRLRTLVRGRPLTVVRRGAAVVLLLLAALLAIRPPPVGTPTLVAARDLAPGRPLTAADLRVVELPESMRPAGALDSPDPARGRLLAGPARTGEPITDVRLVDPHAAPPGAAVVPVRLADGGVAGLLHPGTTVDVVAGGPDERTRDPIASLATVLTVVHPDAQPREGPLGATAGPLVLLAVPTEAASRLAAASLHRPVAVTLR
ncbi:Flp pilus assembly protein CpaB [Amycolatopsis arida]|uniref:Flp pilus assembly protein CpaB n=1 Tax=Amycolatopsis arida TaxID=587909 RepID=A0A1I5Q780_9PSEU|nr:Flp pilus assembly protein CpaB [Amycolatopsis arida]TDX98735.1 Flp pilus assembly protein CpaB [Amycolatopsis arida]SFP41890.1 Flp pilus assembly protein CpaB [Amycolatopsis arida]